MTASLRPGLCCLLVFLAGPVATAEPDPVVTAFDAHLATDPEGRAAFTFRRADYTGDLSALPIGVFDSGIGGLTVLEAILTLDAWNNETSAPGPDGRPDFENERFLYLGDQANMPYGNYAKAGKLDTLRELILKDAVFLLGRRYHEDGAVRHDKPPVKAIVIACNTATAYGLDDLNAAAKRWGIPVIVVGVVEAGARGLVESVKEDETGAIGVLATVGTCDSGVYPRTIQGTLGRAGRGVAAITQRGSPDLAAIIEGDPARTATVKEQVAADVLALVESHRAARAGLADPKPLATIVLGCTHFPLVESEIDAAFEELRADPDFTPHIAPERHYVDPSEWTARQLFRELALAKLRRRGPVPADLRDQFFLSIASSVQTEPTLSGARLNPDGTLTDAYKYGRDPGRFLEDTIIVPMTRAILPESGRKLVSSKLPTVWGRLE